MDEQNQTQAENPKPKAQGTNQFINILLILVILGGAIYLSAQNPQMAKKILMVALGFGAVIMIHELGHFITAKLCGIKVEMFSIGFPPFVLSLRKTKQGFRARLFPQFQGEQAVADDDESTDYCIGLIPFGGFVKMLGQSDTGVAEKTGNPRSYANKPIWQRILVVAAGVIFNAIGAMILFMALFSYGLDLIPPVIGQVIPNSPADIAGLKTGDRIVDIEGKTFLDYTSIVLAAALSDSDRAVEMKVEKTDGSTAEIKLQAEKQFNDPSGLRMFGIAQPSSLTINSRMSDPCQIEELYKDSGFRPGDVITALNGKPFTKPWQLDQYAASALTASARLTVSRSYPKGSEKTSAQIEVPMVCLPNLSNFRTEFDLAHIYSIVPRLKIMEVSGPAANGLIDKIKHSLPDESEEAQQKAGLQKDDIIIQVGPVANPTYKDLRDQTTAHKDKVMPVTVLRGKPGQWETLTIQTRPETITQGKIDRVMLGIIPALDMENPVVAQTIDSTIGPGALQIPDGAQITRVDGQDIKSFYDVIRIIRQNSGQRISIEYKLGADAGGMSLDVPEQDSIHIQSDLLLAAPLEFYRETYKAQNPAQAVVWGVKRTWQFIEQSIVTLIRLFSRTVPTSSLSGPVGIATISYQMAGQGIMDLLNFLGLISACLVVMNLLPLPIVDGGVIVLLIVEKIRGVPLNPKLLEIITWIGLALLLSVFLWVTYNDVLRL